MTWELSLVGLEQSISNTVNISRAADQVLMWCSDPPAPAEYTLRVPWVWNRLLRVFGLREQASGPLRKAKS